MAFNPNTNSPYVITSAAPSGQAGQYLTTGSNGTTAWTSAAMNVNSGGTLELTGDNADIRVNGVSLLKTINQISERLNLLVPNPKIEADWEELRTLGDQYRALEAQLKEQQQTWDLLKKQY
jgi:hypothetical protein